MKFIHVITVALVVASITTPAAKAQTNAGKKLVVREISLGKMPPMVTSGKPVVSPDNRRVAYRVMHGGKYCVAVNGEAGKPYAAVEDLTFSPDGKKLAFVAKKGFRREVVVLDGEEGKEYQHVDTASLTFSPDSSRLAFIAAPLGGTNSFVVLGDKEGADYSGFQLADPDRPVMLFFSPDGRKLAYGAARETAEDNYDYEVVVEGANRKGFPAPGPIIVHGFSPDSQHLAWSAKLPGKWQVVVDGKFREPPPWHPRYQPLRQSLPRPPRHPMCSLSRQHQQLYQQFLSRDQKSTSVFWILHSGTRMLFLTDGVIVSLK